MELMTSSRCASNEVCPPECHWVGVRDGAIRSAAEQFWNGAENVMLHYEKNRRLPRKPETLHTFWVWTNINTASSFHSTWYFSGGNIRHGYPSSFTANTVLPTDMTGLKTIMASFLAPENCKEPSQSREEEDNKEYFVLSRKRGEKKTTFLLN